MRTSLIDNKIEFKSALKKGYSKSVCQGVVNHKVYLLFHCIIIIHLISFHSTCLLIAKNRIE